jgi:hypothetical protein
MPLPQGELSSQLRGVADRNPPPHDCITDIGCRRRRARRRFWMVRRLRPVSRLLGLFGFRLVKLEAAASAERERGQLKHNYAHLRQKALKLGDQLSLEQAKSAALGDALALLNADSGVPDPSIARPIRQASGATQRQLICSRGDGLGARLYNVLWSLRFARKSGARLLVFWPPMSSKYGVDVRSADIFDAAALAAGPFSDEVRFLDARPEDLGPVDRITYLRPDRSHDPADFDVGPALTRGQDKPIPVLSIMHGPILVRGETAAAARREAVALFRELPFHRAVREAVEAASNRRDLSRTVAVHVRGVDILKHLRRTLARFSKTPNAARVHVELYTGHFFRCCAPEEAYERALGPYLDQGFDLLLFADSPLTSEAFTQRFRDRFTLAADLEPPGVQSLQTALFELLLMSRCKAIVGTGSMFATLAALAGDVDIVDVRDGIRPELLVRHYLESIDPGSLGSEEAAYLSRVIAHKLKETPAEQENPASLQELVSRLVDSAIRGDSNPVHAAGAAPAMAWPIAPTSDGSPS